MYGISTSAQRNRKKKLIRGTRDERKRTAADSDDGGRFRTGAASERAITSGPTVGWEEPVRPSLGLCVEIVGSCNERRRFSAAATRTADSLVVDSPDTAEST